MDKQQEAGPSKQGPSKSPKGRRKAPASSTSGNSPKRAKVATPPLGTEQNPVRIDSGSSADSVVCLDPLPAAERSPITESDDSVVSIDLQAESTDSFTDGPSNPGSPENHPNRYSSSSEEDGWISYRPTVKQAQNKWTMYRSHQAQMKTDDGPTMSQKIHSLEILSFFCHNVLLKVYFS